MAIGLDFAPTLAKGTYDAEVARFSGVYSSAAVPLGLLTLAMTAIVAIASNLSEGWAYNDSAKMSALSVFLALAAILLLFSARTFVMAMRDADEVVFADPSKIAVSSTPTTSSNDLQEFATIYLTAAHANARYIDGMKRNLGLARDTTIIALIILSTVHMMFVFAGEQAPSRVRVVQYGEWTVDGRDGLTGAQMRYGVGG